MSGRASGDQIGSALLRENLMPGGPGNLLIPVRIPLSEKESDRIGADHAVASEGIR
jgi:hypothetical protein